MIIQTVRQVPFKLQYHAFLIDKNIEKPMSSILQENMNTTYEECMWVVSGKLACWLLVGGVEVIGPAVGACVCGRYIYERPVFSPRPPLTTTTTVGPNHHSTVYYKRTWDYSRFTKIIKLTFK